MSTYKWIAWLYRSSTSKSEPRQNAGWKLWTWLAWNNWFDRTRLSLGWVAFFWDHVGRSKIQGCHAMFKNNFGQTINFLHAVRLKLMTDYSVDPYSTRSCLNRVPFLWHHAEHSFRMPCNVRGWFCPNYQPFACWSKLTSDDPIDFQNHRDNVWVRN